MNPPGLPPPAMRRALDDGVPLALPRLLTVPDVAEQDSSGDSCRRCGTPPHREGCQRLPVVDAAGRLVGILSEAELMSAAQIVPIATSSAENGPTMPGDEA
jgi:hypothetical protein